jgi:peptidoglycan hydrolase-like protein with peptidoglycan-binding domain
MAIVQPPSAGESLTAGDEGEQVGELQRRLCHLGYYRGNIDQRYGNVTEVAMREFQRASGQVEEGRAGVETWETLEREAQFAGYDPWALHDQAGSDQSAEPGHVSDDGAWRWDGTEWKATDDHAGGRTAAAGTAEPGCFSDDGAWRWDGTRWEALADAKGRPAAGSTAEQSPETGEIGGSGAAGTTTPFDPSAFPDVQPGDSGEWVEYLDAMLANKGF